MIWWGYAGLSGAIIVSMASLASIMGVPTEGVLNLVARFAVALFVLGAIVHFGAIMLRPRPKAPARAPVAVVRAAPSAAQASIKRTDPIAKPVAAIPRAPSSAAVLWPGQPAH